MVSHVSLGDGPSLRFRRPQRLAAGEPGSRPPQCVAALTWYEGSAFGHADETDRIRAGPLPSLLSWGGATYRPFAPILPDEPTVGQRNTLSAQPIEAGASTGRDTAETDARRELTATDTATAVWDLLFRAALERLTGVATEKPVPDASSVPLQAPGVVLCECVAALDRLRRLVPPNSSQQMEPSARNQSQTTCDVPARDPVLDRCCQICRIDFATTGERHEQERRA